MAQGTVAKLAEKEQRRVTKKRVGSFTPLMARIKSTHAEKKQALIEYKRLLSDTDDLGNEKTKIVIAPVFDGSGLPDEVTLKQPKTMAERAAADKRNPLRTEWREGYVVRGFGRRGNRSGCVMKLR